MEVVEAAAVLAVLDDMRKAYFVQVTHNGSSWTASAGVAKGADGTFGSGTRVHDDDDCTVDSVHLLETFAGSPVLMEGQVRCS